MTEGKELKLVTFDTTAARVVLEKLGREIKRIEGVTDPNLACDHVVNAFWTAWHLHEWMWDVMRERPELKAAVLKYRGIDEEGIDNQGAFGTALARRFVPLKICRLIATSPKLVRVVVGSNGASVADEIESHSVPASIPSRDTLMIIVMGKPVAATRILKEIEDYWITLIHECGIEQLR